MHGEWLTVISHKIIPVIDNALVLTNAHINDYSDFFAGGFRPEYLYQLNGKPSPFKMSFVYDFNPWADNNLANPITVPGETSFSYSFIRGSGLTVAYPSPPDGI